MSKNKIVFVVDTDSYAGNFERQMGAFMTGQFGECTVGEDEAQEYQAAGLPDLEDEIMQVPDDKGCYRPVTIYPTEGYYNNGMGFEFQDTPEGNAEALKRLIADTEAYFLPYLKQEEQRIKCKDFSHISEADCLKSIKYYQNEIDKVKLVTQVDKFPSYQSVGVFFNKEPDATLIAQLKSRAQEYANREQIKILGFRIIEEKLLNQRKFKLWEELP